MAGVASSCFSAVRIYFPINDLKSQTYRTASVCERLIKGSNLIIKPQSDPQQEGSLLWET